MSLPNPPYATSATIDHWLSLSWFSHPLISATIGGAIVALSNHVLQRKREHLKLKQEKAEQIVVLTNRLLSLSNSVARKCTKMARKSDAVNIAASWSGDNKEEDFPEINLIRYEILALVRIYFPRCAEKARLLAASATSFQNSIEEFTSESNSLFRPSISPFLNELKQIRVCARNLDEDIIMQVNSDRPSWGNISAAQKHAMAILAESKNATERFLKMCNIYRRNRGKPREQQTDVEDAKPPAG